MDLESFYERHQLGHGRRVVLACLYCAAAVAYVIWRLTVFNPEHLIFSTAFYLAEIFCIITGLLTFFLSWRVRVRSPSVAPRGLRVDVFVPTYNESLPMVRRTLLAAREIEYEHETWLLDDGNRPEMRALAASLDCHYLAREDNVGAKPGNLNHALAHARGDFVAVIDCDHIAQRDYLDRLLGYFDDAQVAYVQAPQDYYNVSAFQYRNDRTRGLLWHDQSSFFHIGQAGRDYWDATTCCGTSTVVRRSVIDEIGGFPEETVTEDMHLAVRAQKLGYKSVYYPLPLAYGVAPTDLGEYQKQRLRWGQGNVQVCREEGLPFARGLTNAQRICYSQLGFLYLEGWSRVVLYLSPPIVLMAGVAPIGPTDLFFWFWIPYALLTYLCFEEMGRGNLRFHINEQMSMARFPVFVAATFAIFRKRIRWRVSSKEFVGHLQVYLLLPQFTVLALNVAAVVAVLLRPPQNLLDGYSSSLLGFVALWATVNVLLALLVIRDAVRCAKHKRADYRFVIPLPLEVQLDGGRTTLAMVERLSPVGMSFRFPGEVESGARFEVAGRIFIPGCSLAFRAHPEAEQPIEYDPASDSTRITCIFEWPDDASRERLDMSLHSCAWHRGLSWSGAYFRTPLEWLGDALGLSDYRNRLIVNWAPALYRRAGDAEEKRFAMLMPGPAGEPDSLRLFEQRPEGDTVELVWSGDGGPSSRRYRLGTLVWPAETVSAGPDDVKVYTYAARH